MAPPSKLLGCGGSGAVVATQPTISSHQSVNHHPHSTSKFRHQQPNFAAADDDSLLLSSFPTAAAARGRGNASISASRQMGAATNNFLPPRGGHTFNAAAGANHGFPYNSNTPRHRFQHFRSSHHQHHHRHQSLGGGSLNYSLRDDFPTQRSASNHSAGASGLGIDVRSTAGFPQRTASVSLCSSPSTYYHSHLPPPYQHPHDQRLHLERTQSVKPVSVIEQLLPALRTTSRQSSWWGMSDDPSATTTSDIGNRFGGRHSQRSSSRGTAEQQPGGPACKNFAVSNAEGEGTAAGEASGKPAPVVNKNLHVTRNSQPLLSLAPNGERLDKEPLVQRQDAPSSQSHHQGSSRGQGLKATAGQRSFSSHATTNSSAIAEAEPAASNGQTLSSSASENQITPTSYSEVSGSSQHDLTTSVSANARRKARRRKSASVKKGSLTGAAANPDNHCEPDSGNCLLQYSHIDKDDRTRSLPAAPPQIAAPPPLASQHQRRQQLSCRFPAPCQYLQQVTASSPTAASRQQTAGAQRLFSPPSSIAYGNSATEIPQQQLPTAQQGTAAALEMHRAVAAAAADLTPSRQRLSSSRHSRRLSNSAETPSADGSSTADLGFSGSHNAAASEENFATVEGLPVRCSSRASGASDHPADKSSASSLSASSREFVATPSTDWCVANFSRRGNLHREFNGQVKHRGSSAAVHSHSAPSSPCRKTSEEQQFEKEISSFSLLTTASTAVTASPDSPCQTAASQEAAMPPHKSHAQLPRQQRTSKLASPPGTSQTSRVPSHQTSTGGGDGEGVGGGGEKVKVMRELKEAIRDVANADFVALDFEFSGLYTGAQRSDLDGYFSSCAESAKHFAIVQVGLCVVKRIPQNSHGGTEHCDQGGSTESGRSRPDLPSSPSSRDSSPEIVGETTAPGGGKSERASTCHKESEVSCVWSLSPFNFFCYPEEAKFLVDAATLKFLRDSNFDFNAWIDEGMDYKALSAIQAEEDSSKRLQQQKQLRHNNANFLTGRSPRRHHTHPASSPSQDSSFSDLASDRGQRGSSAAAAPAATSTSSAADNATASSVINGAASFSSQPLEGGTRSQKLNRVKEFGLQRIIEAIIEHGVPLIVHNGMFDLLHLSHKFIGGIPATLQEFCNEMHRLFAGGIYDTKYLALGCDFHDSSSTSLLPLRSALLNGSNNASAARFCVAPHRQKFFEERGYSLHDGELGNSKAHEAGFDALATAQVFVQELEIIFAKQARRSILCKDIAPADKLCSAAASAAVDENEEGELLLPKTAASSLVGGAEAAAAEVIRSPDSCKRRKVAAAATTAVDTQMVSGGEAEDTTTTRQNKMDFDAIGNKGVPPFEEADGASEGEYCFKDSEAPSSSCQKPPAVAASEKSCLLASGSGVDGRSQGPTEVGGRGKADDSYSWSRQELLEGVGLDHQHPLPSSSSSGRQQGSGCDCSIPLDWQKSRVVDSFRNVLKISVPPWQLLLEGIITE